MAIKPQVDGGNSSKNIFVPRFETPDYHDPNYINTAYGGKNPCIVPTKAVIPGSVLPNCVGYAWGRFMEILGTTPKLSAGDAGTWYGYPYDGYKRGSTPQLGAVLCFSEPGDAGHVAIVEEIKSDGSLIVSQSGYNYYISFWTSEVPPDFKVGNYVFQGFIYNPACENIDTAFNKFMDAVLGTVNIVGDSVRSKYNLSKTDNWNALYPAYCAYKAGLRRIVPTKMSASDFVKTSIRRYDAIWHDGPQLGDNSYIPKPGDIVCTVSDSNKNKSDAYYTDRIAIVAKEPHNAGNMIDLYVIEGDINDRVVQQIYTNTTTLIKGYLELDWSRENSSREGSKYLLDELYEETNDSDDAIIREVAYYGKNQPLINRTDIKLSIINYTSQLASIIKYFSNALALDGFCDDDEIIGNVIFNNPMKFDGANTTFSRTNGSKIFEELRRQGMPASAAIGIMAYMWSESGWNPADINTGGGYSYEYQGKGLCHWSLDWSVDFVKKVPDWKTNMTKQIEYCISGMKTDMGQLYSYLKNLRNTKEDAVKAAMQFSLSYGAGYGFVEEEDLDTVATKWKSIFSEELWRTRTESAAYMWENNITPAVKSKGSISDRE